MSEQVTPEQVRTLAQLADLALEDERLSAAAELLTAWVPAANELSRKMSVAEYDALMPITVLVHPQTGENLE